MNNTNQLPSEVVDDNDTFLLGIGGRIRIRPTVYVVAEIVPRLNGFDPGSTAASFALEKRVGGHAFQLVFSNTFGLTMAQIARGGIENPTAATTGTGLQHLAQVLLASGLEDAHGSRRARGGGSAGFFLAAAAACGRRRAPSATNSWTHAGGGPRRP